MPLSYISPSALMREKKESKTRNPSQSMDMFEMEPPNTSQLVKLVENRLSPKIKLSKKFGTKKNSVKPSIPLAQPALNMNVAHNDIYLSQEYLMKDISQNDFRPNDPVPSLKRDNS